MTFESFDGRYVGTFATRQEYHDAVLATGLIRNDRIGMFGYLRPDPGGAWLLIAHFPHRYPQGGYTAHSDTIVIQAPGEPRPDVQSTVWAWDGNRPKPTLTPSIDGSDERGAGWHGWLRDGKWVGAS